MLQLLHECIVRDCVIIGCCRHAFCNGVVELLPQKIAMNEGYGPVVGCAPFVTEFWNRKIIFFPKRGKGSRVFLSGMGKYTCIAVSLSIKMEMPTEPLVLQGA